MKTTCENEPERRSEKLKEEIAELLFYLQSPLNEDERKRCWRMFELKLREYLAIKAPASVVSARDDGGAFLQSEIEFCKIF